MHTHADALVGALIARPFWTTSQEAAAWMSHSDPKILASFFQRPENPDQSNGQLYMGGRQLKLPSLFVQIANAHLANGA